MTEPPPALRRRLADLRARRAAAAADRAAFEARRRHGLAARHRAKLAYLAEASRATATQEDATPAEHDNDAA